MPVFDSYQGLKSFLDKVFDFLGSPAYARQFRSPLPSLLAPPLSDVEKNIITNIYNSYRRGKGKIVKQIAGEFLRLLHLLVPSLNFDAIFKHLIYLEWMEHWVKPDPASGNPLYRDHILHCANVCWLGHFLLFELQESFHAPIKICLEMILPRECKERLENEEDWKSFIRLTWYITAMMHDFGYPLELVKKKYTGSKLFRCSQHFLKADDRLEDYFKKHLGGHISLFERQVEKIDEKIFDTPFILGDKVHPIIGCIELLHFLKENSSGLSRSVYRYIYQLAALGILEHHNKNRQVDLEENPFGYLLVLADTLHEWQRYICTGPAGSGTKPGFIAPIRKVKIERETRNIYKVKFIINPHWQKCGSWHPDKFRKNKEDELEQLRTAGLPQFLFS